MIYIKDDFLDEKVLDLVEDKKIDFTKVDTPGKSFWVKLVDDFVLKTIKQNIEELENCEITPILAFVREAKEGQDNDWRIHNDSIIEGEQPDRACVLFLSDVKQDGLHGTAFWEHKKHGGVLKEVTIQEQNRLLTEDANDLDLWDLNSIIGHKKNRLISYPCNYFHSKYPNEFSNQRVVFVMFYKTIKK